MKHPQLYSHRQQASTAKMPKRVDSLSVPPPNVTMARTLSIESEPSSDYEDELLFDDMSPEPSSSASSSSSRSPSYLAASLPPASVPSLYTSRTGSFSYSYTSPFKPFSLPASIHTAPTASAFASTSATATSSSHQSNAYSASPSSSYSSSQEYMDFVSAQTRNIAKRRKASQPQSQSQADGDSSGTQSEQQRRRSSVLMRTTVQEEQDERSLLHESTAISSAPAPLSAALLTQKLERVIIDGVQEEVDEEAQRSSRSESPRRGRSRSARRAEAPVITSDHWERSLLFAQWSRRGRAGVWQPPHNTSETLVGLIATLE